MAPIPAPAGPAIPDRSPPAPNHTPSLVHGARIALRWGVPVLIIAAAVLGTMRYRRAHAVAPVHYEVARVDRGPIAAKVTATGALSALVTVSVGSQVSGRIDSLYADFASTVTKGQTVAKIEPSFFRAAVEQARANYGAASAAVERAVAQLAQAEKQLARAKVLRAQGLMSTADFDTAESAVTVARAEVKLVRATAAQTKAALDQAELNLRYTVIVSPIDGVVISRNVDVGQTVAASLQAPTLFTIAQDLTRMQVDTNVAEADVGKVKPAMEVTFTVDAYPARSFRGKIRQVRDNALTVQNVVTYDAVIDVDNSDRLLKPGMTASVVFVYATRSDALRLPNAALRFKPEPATLAAMTKLDASAAPAKRALGADERMIWVLRAGHAASAPVRIGISDGSITEVVGGDIKQGDDVIVEAILEGASH
jgi:HlyD family secretion protein